MDLPDLILDVVDPPGCGGRRVGAKGLAVVPSQVVDAHLHPVKARVEPFRALVHICILLRWGDSGAKKRFWRTDNNF